MATVEAANEGLNSVVEEKDDEVQHDKGSESQEPTPDKPLQETSFADTLPPSAADGPIKTLFPRPLDTCQPPAPPELTTEQQTKYEAVLKSVSEWETVPMTSAKDAKTAPLTDDERMFLTRECLLRYLRATRWNVADATQRLQATLTWRREYGVKDHTPEYISIENETGKQLILGFDNEGRPCLYLNPAQQNTEHSDRQIQHLVFMIERIIDLMGPNQESMALIVNFKQTRSGQNASIGQGRQTLHILQNHYPERLGRAMVINMPLVILGFMKLITPFIDPQTRQKLKFNEDLRQHVPPSHLWRAVNGDVDFVYDHSVYWPALNALAAQRREESRERWVRGGKLVGEHENYLKGGLDKGRAETEAAVTNVAEIEEKVERLNVNGPPIAQPVAA